jgi:hypothetical protein
VRGAPNEHYRHAGEHAETRNRSFTLNSREFHEAVARGTEAWIANGALPRDPRPRDLDVVVEAGRKGPRHGVNR